MNPETLKPITATSGLLTPVASGFGFMAQLNGGRSKEIVIATRGTAGMADASVASIRWVFGLLHQSVNAMAKQAIQLVGR